MAVLREGISYAYFAEDSHLDGARQEQIEKTYGGGGEGEQMEFAEDFFHDVFSFYNIFRDFSETTWEGAKLRASIVLIVS